MIRAVSLGPGTGEQLHLTGTTGGRLVDSVMGCCAAQEETLKKHPGWHAARSKDCTETYVSRRYLCKKNACRLIIAHIDVYKRQLLRQRGVAEVWVGC